MYVNDLGRREILLANGIDWVAQLTTLTDRASTRSWPYLYMPSKAAAGLSYRTNSIQTIGSFLGSIMNSAKDWQDALNSRMPGYRERIVRIALKKHQGGMNLNVGKQTIDTLLDLGGMAAERVRSGHGVALQNQPPFSFDAHRWRRLLSVMESLEKEIPEMLAAYEKDDVFDHPSVDGLERFLNELYEGYDDRELWQRLGYKPPDANEITKLKIRLEAFKVLARAWSENIRDPNWNMPSPSGNLSMASNDE